MKTSKVQGEFIRWGSLAPQMHKIPKERTFHTPPVEKGFYAFPKGFIETFLIGGAGGGSLQNGRYSKFKDKNGKVYKIKGSEFEDFKKKFPKNISKRLRFSDAYNEYWDSIADDYEYGEDIENKCNELEWEIWIENRPNHFKYDGLIWHHLFSLDPPKDKEFPNYIKIVDSWVLTDMKTYLRCLKAEYGKGKWQSQFRDFYDSPEDKGKPKHRKKSPGFNYGGSKWYYSKDDYEVYIEKL